MGFFENLNKSIGVAAPLHFQNERWKEQKEEARRARDINLGLSMLNAGDTETAEKFLRGAMGENAPTNLASLPAQKARLAEIAANTLKSEEEVRKIEAQKKIQEEIVNKMRGVEFNDPGLYGNELGIEGKDFSPEDIQAGLQAGTMTETQREITPQELAAIVMKNDAVAGIPLIKQVRDLEQKAQQNAISQERLQLQQDRLSLQEERMNKSGAGRGGGGNGGGGVDSKRMEALMKLEKMAFDAGDNPNLSQQVIIRTLARSLGGDYRPVMIKKPAHRRYIPGTGIEWETGKEETIPVWRVVPPGDAGKAPAPAAQTGKAGGGKPTGEWKKYLNK